MSNFALILLTSGVFGGAEKRFAQLFKYLSEKNPGKYYFIVSWSLYYRILEIFADYPIQYLIPIGHKVAKNLNKSKSINQSGSNLKIEPGLIKKIYKFTKTIWRQWKYYKEIEKIRELNNIKCLLGIYNGIIPLYFYLTKRKRDLGIIFCAMDSWFREVIPPNKKYWYRKFSSFNYALEKSDFIDFLSPFILKGVKEIGIKIKEESISITPCSFTDYTNCQYGGKDIFQIAFAGRLEKDKNPELFFDAALILAKKYPDMIFHIMGEGKLSPKIEQGVQNSKLPNIKFHGFHYNPTKILSYTSVFVSIQTTNNYPSQSVLEAMACGNAIIATDVGDTRMFINTNNGILIEQSLNNLIEAIEKLYQNRDLCDRLGKYAFDYVRENHSIEKMADYYKDLFGKAQGKLISM